MLRAVVSALLVLGVAVPVLAVDPGKAVGSMTTDKITTTFHHAYAVRKVHNEATNRNDAVKVILTDKPLPAGTTLRDVDYNFPEGILGIVIGFDGRMQPVHVVVQHPAGVYDGGWLDLDHDVTANVKEANGAIEGRVHCESAQKASVTFSFDAEFYALEE